MKAIKPYLGTAVTVLVVLIGLKIVRPMLPDAISKWL
jgi:hypothetical protein